jgi:tight adherence protein C
MGVEITLPIAISLIALLIADSEGRMFGVLAQKSMGLEDKTKVRARLKQLGRESSEDYENFRLAQLSIITIIVGILTFAFIFQVISLSIYLLLSSVSSTGAIYGLEKNLSTRCKVRLQIIESEFPSLIEMLTLAAGAGESPISSLKRISLRAHGHLAEEIAKVVKSVEQGTPFAIALDAMSHRLGSMRVRRFVDSMIISLSRGTSLVETLTHNVQESRNQERVRLLTAAGKAEISMMIPVVFLILPVSILFALFPSITALNFYGA